METVLKTLQIIRAALIVSIVMYAFVGEVAGQRVRSQPSPVLFYALSFIAVALVMVMFMMRRLLILPSELALAQQPSDEGALNRWRTGYVVTYALSESVGLLGLVLRILGFTLSQVVPLYVGGFVLLAFFGPRRPSRFGAQ
jgi:hypothetical protein